MLGTGLNSPQQRALRLLQLLDPKLSAAMGIKQFRTGDYSWRDELLPELIAQIEVGLKAWVTLEPPYGYDENDPSDVALWRLRHEAALRWVKSEAAHKFSEWLYK